MWHTLEPIFGPPCCPGHISFLTVFKLPPDKLEILHRKPQVLSGFFPKEGIILTRLGSPVGQRPSPCTRQNITISDPQIMQYQICLNLGCPVKGDLLWKEQVTCSKQLCMTKDRESELHLNNYDAVSRKAPGTPGLLNINQGSKHH